MSKDEMITKILEAYVIVYGERNLQDLINLELYYNKKSVEEIIRIYTKILKYL